jgi:hypothetical protein
MPGCDDEAIGVNAYFFVRLDTDAEADEALDAMAFALASEHRVLRRRVERAAALVHRPMDRGNRPVDDGGKGGWELERHWL